MSDHLLLDEPFVAVNPGLIRATGSASRAIVLQTLWFARDRTTGTTTMTMEQVAERTGLSHRTVDRATTWARGAGVLTRSRAGRFDPTSVWTVAPDVLATLSSTFSPNGEHDDAKVAQSESANLASSVSAKVASTSYENPEEPPTGKNTPPLTLAMPEPVDEQFAQFWAMYPRHTDKAKAETAFKRARKRYPLSLILGGVERLVAENREPRFIPHPTTWLNGKRWEDEPLPPSNADRDRAAFSQEWADGSALAGWEAVAGRGTR